MTRITPLLDVFRHSLINWADDAACKNSDGEAWFADERDDRHDQAKAICQTCPVINECLTHALNYEHDGIWGGLSPKERETFKRQTRRGNIT
jgi:WhiB family redox-sensing transcriptional regulator